MTVSQRRRFQVGHFVYEPGASELQSPRRRVRLRPQTAALLDVLIAADGAVVSRQAIRDALWSENSVLEFDLAIAACVKQLRRAFKDDASAPKYVETIPKKGYRLIAELTPVEDPDDEHRERADSGRSRSWAVLAAIVGTGIVIVVLAVRLLTASDTRVMVFVAPMQSFTDERALHQASDIFTDSLIGSLGGIAPQRVGVISRTTAQAVDAQQLTAGQIGENFGADFLVEATLRRLGDEISLSIRLIGTQDDAVVWGELISLDGAGSADIASAVSYVADAIVTTVAPDVLPPIEPLQVIRLDPNRAPRDE